MARVVHQRWAVDSLSKAVYVSEQVCIAWHRTGAYDTAKLTFSHDFPFKVWGAYCTSVHIIFNFFTGQSLSALIFTIYKSRIICANFGNQKL